MSGLGAFGGAPKLAAEDAGGMVAPFKSNPLVALLTAIGQFPQMQRNAQQQKLQLQQQEIQNKYLPQQIEAQTSEQQAYAQQVKMQSENAMRQAAMQRWGQIGQMALANPQWAKSPRFIHQAVQTAQQLGIPPPLNADGSLNTDTWKTPWQEAILKDKTLIGEILALPPGPVRDPVLNSFSGVPDSLRTAKMTLSPRDQAAILRAQGMFESDRSLAQYRMTMANAAQHRVQIQAELAQGTLGVDAARIVQLHAAAQKAQADAQTALAKTAIAAQNAATRSGELNLAMQRFQHTSSLDSLKYAQSAAKSTTAEVHNLDTAINTIAQQQITATYNDAPEKVLTDLNNRLYDLQTRRSKLMNQLHQANQILGLGSGNSAVAGTARAQGAGKRVTATDVGSKLPKVRKVGNTTYYLHSDGKYYSTP